MKQGLLIILSGPSGVGKGAVRRALMENKDLDIVYSISMTTRAPRRLEQNGVDYFFVDEETFQKNVEEGNFLEYVSFVGHSYGTPKQYVDSLRNEGKNVLLEIEVQGATQVLKKMKELGDKNIVSIFLLPPSWPDLEKRIRKRRTETEDVIKKRMDKARSEIKEMFNYDYQVLNDIVPRAATEIKNIIESEIDKRKDVSAC